MTFKKPKVAGLGNLMKITTIIKFINRLLKEDSISEHSISVDLIDCKERFNEIPKNMSFVDMISSAPSLYYNKILLISNSIAHIEPFNRRFALKEFSMIYLTSGKYDASGNIYTYLYNGTNSQHDPIAHIILSLADIVEEYGNKYVVHIDDIHKQILELKDYTIDEMRLYFKLL